MQGLIARHPWLSVGRIPAGRYDLVRSIPASDKLTAQLATLLVASPCARRADRVAMLMLVSAELPGFTRSNPPSATSSATLVRLAPSAHQFFLTGEPELADRYFPWLVNLMSPAYWVYLRPFFSMDCEHSADTVSGASMQRGRSSRQPSRGLSIPSSRTHRSASFRPRG